MNASMNFISNFINEYENEQSSNNRATYTIKISDLPSDLTVYGNLIANNLGLVVIYLSNDLFKFEEAYGMETDFNLDIAIKVVEDNYEFSLSIYTNIEESDNED